jgi:hypothetical protein
MCPELNGRNSQTMENISQYKINRFKEFWNRTNKTPLTSYSIGSYFPLQRYNAALKLMEYSNCILPQMINVEDFKSDYLRLASGYDEINRDSFYTATPLNGFPWMEAILGCEVYSTKVGFMAHAQQTDINKFDAEKSFNEPWFNKYIEFTCKLNEWGKDKFPIGQPILRGPTDIVGTILGQEQFVYDLHDDPEKVVKLMNDSVDIFLNLIKEQKKHIDSFYGGSAIGFYDLWCPEDCIWFQDDLNALLSPDIYKKYIQNIHRRICKGYQYSLIHLHPVSFYIVDYLLEIDELSAIQITKDVGGPTVEEMMPVLKKVQNKKNLVLWGDFDSREIDMLMKNLRPEGLYITYYGPMNQDIKSKILREPEIIKAL